MRVFPLSNWTELDVWHYIELEKIPVVPFYFAKEREVLVRGALLIPVEQPFVPRPPAREQWIMCRMRSLGCTCTGAIRSTADTVSKIIQELNGRADPSAKTGSSITTRTGPWKSRSARDTSDVQWPNGTCCVG